MQWTYSEIYKCTKFMFSFESTQSRTERIKVLTHPDVRVSLGKFVEICFICIASFLSHEELTQINLIYPGGNLIPPLIFKSRECGHPHGIVYCSSHNNLMKDSDFV